MKPEQCPNCGEKYDSLIHNCMAQELPITEATLRDQFAMAALQGICQQDPVNTQMLSNPKGRDLYAWFASDAYCFADAMMKARE